MNTMTMPSTSTLSLPKSLARPLAGACCTFRAPASIPHVLCCPPVPCPLALSACVHSSICACPLSLIYPIIPHAIHRASSMRSTARLGGHGNRTSSVTHVPPFGVKKEQGHSFLFHHNNGIYVIKNVGVIASMELF
jgi:hypothetical protein